MMDWISSPEAWIALGTLSVLEIVLGVDNVVFISVVTGRLPEEQQPKARRLGLLLAMVMRILLLFSISWVMKLTTPLFNALGRGISGKDLILILGGLFLLAKATMEIHHKLEGYAENTAKSVSATFTSVLIQIILLDLVFSLDSVITAVGMADDIMVMVIAIVLAVAVMMLSAEWVSKFVKERPTVTILALSFLLLIGMSLVAEGMHFHVPKGYLYFAMGFSVFVEFLNLKLRKRRPVKLHNPAEDLK